MAPLIEAHRGDSSHAPENTLAAFKRALGLAVPSIELDVHPSRDGTLMVIHDDTVDRTTDGSGRVIDMAVDELLRLDAGVKFGPAFAGERIPRLGEVLKMVVPTQTRLNVEIKSSPAGANVPQNVAELLRRFGKQREYIVSSVDLPCLLQVRAIDPEIALALIGNGPVVLTYARQHGLPWIHCNYRTVDHELVEHAHREGIRVNVWTVDDAKTLPYWRTVGVDKICTNRPAQMLAAAALLSGRQGTRPRAGKGKGASGTATPTFRSNRRKTLKVIVNDLMQKGYVYYITEPAGMNFAPEFFPELTPKQMLEMGVFGGRYMTDCRNEFPADWFARARLCHERHDPALNYFGVNASQPLSVWREKGWIYHEDPRGWFQWYCRYYLGRRCPDDQRQISRWKGMMRHIAQIGKHCRQGDMSCRAKQRQALLNWAYDSRRM